MAESVVLSEETPRTFALVLAEAESATGEILAFASGNAVSAASITAIGAFSTATLGFFDLAAKRYREIPVREQAEVLSLVGDIGVDADGRPALHAHVVLGLPDGSTRGGHLMSATVRPTLEVMVTESPGHLRRRYRDDLGLALIDPRASEGEPEHGFTPEAPLRHGLAP